MKLTALTLFIITYVLMIALPKIRPWAAFGCAAIFVAIGILPLRGAFGAIDYNVLMMLAGTMGTVWLFIESGMPNRIAEALLRITPNVMWVVVVMSLFAGIVSAFIDNVATVLMIAPVGLAIAKRLDISPVAMLICIAVSSNLQGAATLVGDTTSIMLGGYAGMDFMDFFFFKSRPSIFFAVEIGALVTVPVIVFLFRRQRDKVEINEHTEVTTLFPTFLLIATVLGLILASFIKDKPAVTNGLICIALFIAGCIHSYIKEKRSYELLLAIRSIDYETLLLLASLFVVIAGVNEVGLIKDASSALVALGGGNLFIMYTLIVWGSVLISAFVDNIPYVATMLPVVSGIAGDMGCSPYLLFFGLLVGATLGGNLTPVGASANIAAIGILRKNGFEVKTRDFMRIGIPFTLCAVTAGYIYCWIFWAK